MLETILWTTSMILGIISLMPQIHRSYKLKSCKSLSFLFMWISIAGMSCMIGYLFLTDADIMLMIYQGVIVLLFFVLIGQKAYYDAL